MVERKSRVKLTLQQANQTGNHLPIEPMFNSPASVHLMLPPLPMLQVVMREKCISCASPIITMTTAHRHCHMSSSLLPSLHHIKRRGQLVSCSVFGHYRSFSFVKFRCTLHPRQFSGFGDCRTEKVHF